MMTFKEHQTIKHIIIVHTTVYDCSGFQSEKAQSILDDLFGLDNSTRKCATAAQSCSQQPQSTFVAFYGNKVFASPPAKYLLTKSQLEAESPVTITHHQPEAIADTSQMFEPSQLSPTSQSQNNNKRMTLNLNYMLYTVEGI